MVISENDFDVMAYLETEWPSQQNFIIFIFSDFLSF